MEEKLLNDSILSQVRDVFQQLTAPVEVLFFGQETDCEYCQQTQQLVEEVVEVSDKLSLKSYDLQRDAELARQYHVDKAPTLILAGKNGSQPIDYGVRFAGIPAGHEFSSLIHGLVLVSNNDSGLNAQTRELLGKLKKPVHMQVFVTPNCPYCPQAVVLAHQMALESPLVQAEMVEASEFPELADRFNVSGVPQTTINAGAGTVVGAYPEEGLLAEILRATS
ncbi:MAG: thioredoxin family protein [Anaerolineales bacterium]|nr:thioredoxin family protein [Anaerolineales bacterium]